MYMSPTAKKYGRGWFERAALAGLIHVVTSLVLAVPYGALVMLAMTPIHDWWPSIPTMGYWTAYRVTYIALLLFDRSGSKR